MARLPQPGADQGTWGTILNAFLDTAHNADGTLKNSSVQPATLNAGTPSAGQVLGYNGAALAWSTPAATGTTPDASTTTKGLVQLAGDLAGTAAAPTVPGLAAKASTAALSSHATDTANPHAVNKAQVGLGNVDNTTDAGKPISTATATALSAKANTSSLAAVATSGSYTDLLNKPTGTATGTNTGDQTLAVSGANLTISGGNTVVLPSGGSSTSWGLVAGTLSDQVDLQSALTAKADASAMATALGSKINTSEKGANSGVASLDSAGKIPVTQLGTGTASATNFLRGDGSWVVPSSGGSVTSANITDATTIGRSVLTGADAAAIRTAIGAGTSSLAIGITSTTAKAGNYLPTASDVGLGNVDNTSDANKPVSGATQTALNLKAPLASPTFTGAVIVPTPSISTHAATKAYVDSAVSGAVGGINVVARSADYTASAFDFVIGTATSAGFTVTLPPVSAGIKVSIKKVDSSTNAITVTPQSGLIDNLGSDVVNQQWMSMDYMSDGTKWYRI